MVDLMDWTGYGRLGDFVHSTMENTRFGNGCEYKI